MERIQVSELSHDPAAVLARVAGGESLEITISGEPVTLLTPVIGRIAGLDELTRRRRLTPAVAGPLTLPPGPADRSTDSADIVADLREERHL